MLTILCKQTKMINKLPKCSTTTYKKMLKYNKNNYESTKIFFLVQYSNVLGRGRRGRDRMVVGFTTTYAISASSRFLRHDN